MKKRSVIDQNKEQMPKNTFLTLLLSAILLLPGAQPMWAEQPLKTDFQPYNSNYPPIGYYIVVQKTSEKHWEIIVIDDKPTKRENDKQEVLYLDLRSRIVQPFFEEYKYDRLRGDFDCLKYHIKAYSPCTSQLTRSSAGVNSMLSSSLSRTLNKDEIEEIVVKTNLVDKTIEYINRKKELH